MGFSPKQVQELKKDIDQRNLRHRHVNGRELTYLEGWHAMSEANRIFGFDCWNRETLDVKCVLSRENRGTYLAVYTVKVRVTVRAGNQVVVREGHGTSEGRSSSPGEAHEYGLKAAETDATKRALATFGNAFGLGLYGGSGTRLKQDAERAHSHSPVLTGVLPPDMPIPSSSKYDRPHELVDEQQSARQLGSPTSVEASLAPEQTDETPGKIDKSLLTIGVPRRLRDKAHLRFVAAQPCLVCGRQPSDAHHLKFTQLRAMGLKVSDEFTVPLCRGHHRSLHQAGNELAWWEKVNVSPLDIADRLWRESRSRFFPNPSES